MRTFEHLESKIGLVPAGVATVLGRIDERHGREDLYREQRPATLDRLVSVARVQSAESSNAIEGVVASPRRLRDLMAERTDPRNRSEAEIAGYRAALDLIHQGDPAMVFTPGVVLQLHRDLYQFTPEPGGRWKPTDNHIEAIGPDGALEIVFKAHPAARTPDAMDTLHGLLASALDHGHHHRLLLIGSYVLDVLCIHPFRDGNGRMARLLTLLLLYRGGYEVGRYVSLERLIETSKDSYYETLRVSSLGWHEGEHDPWPWLNYFLGVLLAAYDQFEERVGAASGRGAKREAIERFLDGIPAGGEFTVAEVRRHAVGAGDSYISKTLTRLRDDGLIEALGTGRGARWRKVAS